MIREIVVIDEKKCDGCGQCVPACHEGAIRVVDGKARLISDRLCDGLGACLGHCPQDAIRLDRREAGAFDERLVAGQTAPVSAPRGRAPTPGVTGMTTLGPLSAPHSCPSSHLVQFGPQPGGPRKPPVPRGPTEANAQTALTHWPVQLHLVPPTAPFLAGSDLLICATCVPVAMPDFQDRLLAGRSIVLACPKLDDQTGYFEKLATMFASGELRSVTVARMEVPCCCGLTRLAAEAHAAADSQAPLREIVVSCRGAVLAGHDAARTPA